MKQINHWTEAINKWKEYKEEHPEASDVFEDFEKFFGLDSDGELSKFCAWYYYDIDMF